MKDHRTKFEMGDVDRVLTAISIRLSAHFCWRGEKGRWEARRKRATTMREIREYDRLRVIAARKPDRRIARSDRQFSAFRKVPNSV